MMRYELIITEKPSTAKKIADALDNAGKPIRKGEGGVYYYFITHGNKDIIVCSAVGHLFTVAEKNKGEWKYPVFDIEWVQSGSVSKAADHTKKYAATIKKLAKDAAEFTVATDYDIEGEVIGFTIIKYLCKQKDANRMKFSTLTKPDLVKAYANKAKTVNWGQVRAGVTRHELDWYYGINLSRALTLAVRNAGQYKVLSAGRVQGPALKIIVDKEKLIMAFVSTPYWEILLTGTTQGQTIEAMHTEEKFLDKAKAQTVLQKTTGKDATVCAVDEKEFTQAPPVPFDLTTLQTESYRVHGISPQQTLAIAQDLYTSGFISYPRTSSQKLPKELELDLRIADLLRNPTYKALAQKLLDNKWTIPKEGLKTDDAHPAIYPTGIMPTSLEDRDFKVYDLIVRRFLACFADEAKRATVTIDLAVTDEHFIAKGTRTTYKGWHEFYGPYAKFDEVVLPSLSVGHIISRPTITLEEKQTKPPKRYTPASIIKELEKRNLGTKATRAAIVDHLYNRGYIADKNIKATPLGIQTIDILDKYSPSIIDDNLTRQFEEQLEDIRQQNTTPEKVLDKAKELLTSLLADFKLKQKQIGQELLTATRDAEDVANTTVPCPVCRRAGRSESMMMVKKGKFGRFLGCSSHPDCTFTYRLPPKGTIKATGKIDEATGQELLSIGTGKIPVIVNIDPESAQNKEAAALQEQANEEQSSIPGIGEQCPACGQGSFVLRKSMYGMFLGCNNYPKCKTMRSLSKKEDGSFVLGAVVTKKDDGKKPAAKRATVKKTTTKKKSSKPKSSPGTS